MTGKILIVDDLATNRIVLKVKLAEAFYEVLQADTGVEALKIAAVERPDLILSNGKLSDFNGAKFTQALRADETLADIPIVLLFDKASDPDKLTALMAGANEVLIKPVNEPLLLARLRSLLRQHHTTQDLQLHAGAACAFGFDEAQQQFLLPGCVALVAPHKSEALHLQSNLTGHSDDAFLALTPDLAAGHAKNSIRPDIYVLQFARGGFKSGLRLMAELRASPKTRHCPIIVLPGACDTTLQATILDMGANDVVSGEIDPSELALRISAQLRGKRHADQMRNHLHDGLKAALIDPLTGLYNRRYALPYLERMIKSAQSEGKSFAVMVADIDHFKHVNDRFGHATGDKVLEQVAQSLRANMRENDMIARIGGEEFLIVAEGYSRKQAVQAANRMCRIIQRLEVTPPRQPGPVQVTISIGVAMGPGKHADTSPDTLLDQADQALFGAKADGRNTVILSKNRPAA